MKDEDIGKLPGSDESSLSEEERERQERVAQLVDRALDELRKERERVGSYYALIPRELRGEVGDLAARSFPHYGGGSREADFTSFRETFCQAWLANKRVFEVTMVESGYAAVGEIAADMPRDEKNRLTIAAFSQNASSFFLGQGAFQLEGGGTSLRYVRMPYREDKEDRGTRYGNVPSGVAVLHGPRVGTRLALFLTKEESEGKRGGQLYSSPLVSLYVKGEKEIPPPVSDEEIAVTSKTLAESSQRIDLRTLGKLTEPNDEE